jgi:hypothetical protein
MSRIVVDEGAESDERLAYVLEHIDRQFESLRQHIDERIATELDLYTKRMSTDSDMARPYWVTGSNHIASHWWGWMSKRGMAALLGAVVVALLIWLGSLGIVFKGAPK